ncbi:MAG: hypothetical protein U9P14_11125, partial [Gemmatimonadota bacterium]|nr:hypothetical protein [Gemmatimonadota bacterium]
MNPSWQIKAYIIGLFCLLAALWFPVSVTAQQEGADTSLAASGADSLEPSMQIPEPDSLMKSLLRAHPGRAAGETIIYSGENLTFYPRRNVMLIRGQAEVQNAAQVVRADTMIAYNRATGDVFVSGNPELEDRSETVTGYRMRYNVNRDRGVVERGRTKFGEWGLVSESLSKVGADSIFGRNNTFSSCDLEPGHR